MPQRLHPTMRRPAFQPLAIAAAAALMLGTATPVHAQLFSSGANSTSPVNLLPFAGAPTVLNFGDNILYVGNAALGSFSALAGAVLNAGALSIANGGTGVGTVTLSGVGTKVELGANLNRLEVGNWGSGTLSVTGGALLDAAFNSGNCSNCFNVIGNGAGSTGTLTISGASSEVRTLRSFVVGQTSVFTNPPDGTTFGTPGGTTTASVSVVSGGTLRTEGATVASNNGSPSGNGQETVTGTVVVSGNNSQWIVLRNSIDTVGNTAALMSIGNGAGANGLVTVSAGGKLHVDGTGSSGPNDGLHIGGSGKGKLTVTGADSQVMTSGVNHFIHVGGINSLGDGSFEILAGASASTLYLNVGLNGGTGTMLIDGAGSTLTQSGVGIFQAAFVNGPAGASIGRDMGGGGGTGIVTVSNGGQWLISDGGGDGRTPAFGPSITVGHGANSAGSLTITGSGSKVEITASSLNPGAGVGDNYNPFVSIGFDNADTSSGELNILAGGKLILNGNAVSAPGALSRATGVNIGGRSGAAGTGTATVSGLGSEIRIAGSDAYINVGRTDGSTGTLNVQNQALVTATSLAVGIGSTTPGTGQALGTVNIDNAKILLSGFRTDTNPQIGAGTTFGRGANGVAVLNMSNGGQLEIAPSGFGGGMSIGGDQFLGGGLATVTLSGGSSIVRGGPFTGIGMNIGWSGTGIVNLSGASFIDVGTGAITLAGVPTAGQSTGNGTLTLAGGSKASANNIHIGGNSDVFGAAGVGGTGTVTVSGRDIATNQSSELKASGVGGFIGVGRGGNGTLIVTDQGKVSAIGIAVGRNGGVGQLLAQNATIELSGEQTAGTSPSGAFLTIGSGGIPDPANPGNPGSPGTGIVTLVDSTVAITNAGSLGTGMSVGGSGSFPGGTGILGLTNSQITVNAAAGVGNVNIGRTGVGVATLSASTISNANGNVFIGREVGSSGLLTLSAGSVINADYVGVGVSAKGVVGPNNSVTQFAGGAGTLILNDSTINASMFELGASSTLTGNNGTVDVLGDGPIVIGGMVAPGNSPGRLRFKSNVILLPGSRIELEVSGSGNDLSGYEFDQLIIGEDSIFDLAGAEIVFTFLGDTDPNIVSSLGGLDLNNYFRAGSEVAAIDAPTQSLQTLFASGQTWADVIDTSKVSAVSENPNFSSIEIVAFDPVTGMAQVVAVPEPSTWGMMFLGLAAVGAVARRRKPTA